MTWVKLDDNFFAHPKVVDLTKDQKLLYLASLAYAAANLTDGHLTASAIRIVAATVDVIPAKNAQALVTAALWEKRDGEDGYFIHDFNDYNPRGEEVKAVRKHISSVRSEAGRRGAAAKWGRNSQGEDSKSDGKTYSKADDKQNGNGDSNNSDKAIAKRMAPSESRPNPEDSESQTSPESGHVKEQTPPGASRVRAKDGGKTANADTPKPTAASVGSRSFENLPDEPSEEFKRAKAALGPPPPSDAPEEEQFAWANRVQQIHREERDRRKLRVGLNVSEVLPK